jgi:hypothetical protein
MSNARERKASSDLMAALRSVGITAFVSVNEYKEAPGSVLELMLSQADAEKLTQALTKGAE